MDLKRDDEGERQPAAVPPVAAGREPMERVRLGLTGLAGILVIVALATAIASGVQNRLGPAPDNSLTAATTNAETPEDPLAKLGVAPAPSDANVAVNAQAAP